MAFISIIKRSDEIDIKSWIIFRPKYNRELHLTIHERTSLDPRFDITTNLNTILAIILPFISLYLIPISLLLMCIGWGHIEIKLPIYSDKEVIFTRDYQNAGVKNYGIYLHRKYSKPYKIIPPRPDRIVLLTGNDYKEFLLPSFLIEN